MHYYLSVAVWSVAWRHFSAFLLVDGPVLANETSLLIHHWSAWDDPLLKKIAVDKRKVEAWYNLKYFKTIEWGTVIIVKLIIVTKLKKTTKLVSWNKKTKDKGQPWALFTSNSPLKTQHSHCNRGLRTVQVRGNYSQNIIIWAAISSINCQTTDLWVGRNRYASLHWVLTPSFLFYCIVLAHRFVKNESIMCVVRTDV